MTIKKFIELRKEHERQKDIANAIWSAKHELTNYIFDNYPDLKYEDVMKYVERQMIDDEDGRTYMLSSYEQGLQDGESIIRENQRYNAEAQLTALQKKILHLHDTYGLFKFLGD